MFLPEVVRCHPLSTLFFNMKPHTTILSIVFGFIVLNFLIPSVYINYALAVLVGLSLFSLKFSIFIEYLWGKLAFVLSQIIPNILLLIIFYFFLTPIALISKLFKAKTDFISVNDRDSFFIDVNKSFSKKSFERGW